ncbi:MAG: hypothetical protein GX945_09520 [Lentisphaerae bacterium]|jgi:predicted dehydrogenase|nr:hypothetical protein [Lentisphaerota bacterium]
MSALKTDIISPREAARRRDDGTFCPAFYWRSFPVVAKIREMVVAGLCGDLRSLRFTASRPRKHAADEACFVYDRFSAMLDGAGYLADAPCRKLYIEKCAGANNLFALAEFANGVVAEFEANECLPDSLPDIAFVKANFSAGHVTNQPLVGYFNEEGLLYADDKSYGQYIADDGLKSLAAGPFAWMESRFALAVERGEVAPGKLGCERWLSMIAEVLS